VLRFHECSKRVLSRPTSTAINICIFFVLYSTFWDPSITSVSIEVVLLLPLVMSIAILRGTSK